jgi:UDP-glucose 4-epimerase
MRILITGVAGFIGSHLAEHFLEAGHDVFGIDNLSTGRRENIPDDVAFMESSIGSKWAVNNAFRQAKPEVVYHCAASYSDPDDWERDDFANVTGTIHVARASIQAKVRRLVYFQTSLCYGVAPESPVKVGAPLNPTSSYAISKTAAEQYLFLSGLDVASLRLANIFGPRNLSGPIPTFYRRLTEGQPVTVVDTRRDFVFIADLVRAAVMFAEPHTPGGVWHIGSGADVSILQVFRLVRGALGLADVPTPDVTPRGPDDAETILIDPSLTEAEFGWRAGTTMRSMEDGIDRAVAWYREHGVTNTFTHLKEPVRS